MTDRPGETGLSYTSNWPHDPLVGNTLTGTAAFWSMVSIVLLLAGIAAMIWFHGAAKHEPDIVPPKADPLAGAVATPSMKATRKYFFAVAGLILLQVAMGVIMARNNLVKLEETPGKYHVKTLTLGTVLKTDK